VSVECQYCGESFDSVHERGVHVADKHVDSDSNIERVERSKSKKKNILDEYSVPDEAEHI